MSTIKPVIYRRQSPIAHLTNNSQFPDKMNAQHQQNLCQFFTSDVCSDALVAEMDHQTPNVIADVGAGHGSLASAAMRRWGQAQIALFDRDHLALRTLKYTHPGANRFHADFLLERMPRNARKWIEQADVVLCNPPFKEALPEVADRWLAEAGMPTHWSIKIKGRAEVVFLAHNLRMLRRAGELAMILPAAFICGHEFEPFRAWLLSTLTVTKVLQLPQSAFTTAEVKAYAIIVRKSPPSDNHQVQLIDMSHYPFAHSVKWISPERGIERLDPGYHRFDASSAFSTTLGEMGAVISRGLPVSELVALNKKFFHTTDFAKRALGAKLSFSPSALLPDRPVAKAGDVLLGRIGRRCHSQVAHVSRGRTLFSDCVYRIELPAQHRATTLASLTDSRGILWRQAHLRGSTVHLLSKQDLLKHPVWMED